MHRSFTIAVLSIGLVVAVAPSQSAAWAQDSRALREARNRMVNEDVVAAGVRNSRVIRSMRGTLRHEFIPPEQRDSAYVDMALPIGARQTISPPFVVAYMTEQLDPQPTDKVLEIGTGSGYQAAVLAPLVAEVYTIEIVEELGVRAAAVLAKLGYRNVYPKIGDGYQGWPEHAPFDKIIVTCSPEDVPQALVDQLREGGRMIVPLGERYQQTLYLFRKEGGELVREALLPTLFVPMTGQAEDERDVLPDPANPQLRNGSFEDFTPDEHKPFGWHYQRQLRLITAADAPDGQSYVAIFNRTPGRGAQALQGFALDGRQVHELHVAAWIRGRQIAEGQTREQLPVIAVTFYDELRDTVSHQWLGPWSGSFDWTRVDRTFQVPETAREALIRIGLFGGVGEIAFDGVEVRAVP